TGELAHKEGELSVNPKVHSGDCMADSHETRSLLHGDKVLEPIVNAAEHDISLQHVTKQTIDAEVSRCSQELPACSSQGGSPRKTVASDSVPIRRKRNLSCPPGGGRSIISGPWSLEWLNDHNHGDACIIFSSKKKLNKNSRPHGEHSNESSKVPKKKRAGGVLRHTMQSLKKVARLPCKDRKEVLKILKRQVRKRSGQSRVGRPLEVVNHATSASGSSLGSVNKDWEHWVALHG
ncbi:DUF4283 domain protein, partial [Trifolium medium]|nr:DUF4283 domain protein [Trifolium medium]